jgi:hypothetical protein
MGYRDETENAMKKLNFGEGGFQGFMGRHAEKGALGLAVLTALYLMYAGYGVETIKEEPNSLTSLATSARQNMQLDSWERVMNDEDRVITAEFEAQEKLGSIPTKPHDYGFSRSLSPSLTKPIIKRPDPDLYPPIKVIARSIVVPIAVKNVKELPDPLSKLEYKAPPAPRQRKSKRDREKEGSGGLQGMDDENSGAASNEDQFFGSGDSGDSGAEDRKSWPRRGPYNPPGSSGGSSSAPGIGSMLSTSQPGGEDAPVALPKRAFMVCVTALVPYEMQFNEFKAKLENAIAYEPSRDRPRYLSFAVERTEVIAGGEEKWEVVGDARSAVNRLDSWASPMGAPEVAHDDYVLLGTTTMPIPPFLNFPYRNLVSSPPEIPFRGQKLAMTEEASEEATSDEPDSELPMQLPTSGGSSGGIGSSGLPGMGSMDMSSGGDSSDGSEFAGGMGNSMTGAAVASVVTEYKLVRFFDFKAMPGKEYRYRVQLWVEDPNNPRNTELDINLRMLESDASDRLVTIRDGEKIVDGQRRSGFIRKTEYSEPSNPISLSNDARIYAGPANKLQFLPNSALAEVPTKVAGKVSAVKTDLSLGVVDDVRLSADVPVNMLMAPGDVLASEGDLNFVHPISLSVKTLEDYDFYGNAVLVDMYGGYSVGGTLKEGLMFSLGEYAFINANGELEIRKEINDADDYRYFGYVEDEPEKSGAGGMGGPGGGGFDIGIEGF